jgi:hypothetical protein
MLGDEVWRTGPSDGARNLARGLSAFGVVLTLWTVFKPWPYPVVITLNILAPWLGVFAVWRWGLSLADQESWTDRPEIAALWLLPCFMLAMRARDHHIVDGGVFWAMLALAAPLWIALLLVDAGARRWWAALLLILPCLAWAWGALSYLDVGLDRSKPTLVAARVVESRSLRRSTPTMTVRPLSPVEPGNFRFIQVSERAFVLYPPGSTTCLEVHEGFFGWRYLYVVDCL